MSEFTFESTVETRFRDTDIMGQVHNAVILMYVEEARIRYYDEVVGIDFLDVNSALVHQSIDYRKPITYPGTLIVEYRTAELGRSRRVDEFAIETDGEIAAKGTVIEVILDDSGDPAEIPTEWVDRIQEYESGSVERTD